MLYPSSSLSVSFVLRVFKKMARSASVSKPDESKEKKSEGSAASSSSLSLLSNEEELKKRRERYFSQASPEMKSLLSLGEEGVRNKNVHYKRTAEEQIQLEKERNPQASDLLQQIEHLLSSKSVISQSAFFSEGRRRGGWRASSSSLSLSLSLRSGHRREVKQRGTARDTPLQTSDASALSLALSLSLRLRMGLRKADQPISRVYIHHRRGCACRVTRPVCGA